MNKKLLFTPLLGIFTLSLLSSCRTEDGAITQKQIEDKRFSVFVPKDGKPVNYADGFALVMKKYDEKKNTNLSGINNNLVINNLTASAGKRQIVLTSGKKDIYVEFNIRSETIEEKNGDKWVIYPRVQGTKVKELVVMLLTEKETLVKFFTYNKQTSLYKEYGASFQEALDKYLSPSNKLNLNASIKPIAEGETLIKEVILTVKRKAGGISPGTPGEGEPGMGGDGAVDCFGIEQCIRLNPGGGGESSTPIDEADKIDITDLQKYPCAFAVAQLLPNLENNISTLLKDTFGNNNKTNITFKVDAIESEDPNYFINAVTNYPPIEKGVFNATVILNKEMVQIATQEYIASVMYHEIVHAYLGYEFNILGSSAFEQKYPAMETYMVSSTRKFRFKDDYQHTRYAPFIDRMTDSIMDFSVKNNPNSTFTKESAKAIAMGGLFKDLSIAIKQIINDESTSNSHSKGTKCQNN
ncbi:hypothetical protein [Elizabethkingia anophelis]|uniref:hypothetical protein n=1 Tax=Elizabethkingia anophelis TaxID=1117645 RepID=UPI001F2660BD|nr:hypothetical protein [Elizabethkingia anophelis]WJK00490.1 hypothetical protein QTN78_01855 [Elizabethkingia anophelis]